MIRHRADAVVAFVTTIFVALSSIVHWLARPHLVSIILMVFWLTVIEDFRRNRSRWIYFPPPGIALWANLHGVRRYIPYVLAAYAIGEWVRLASRGEWWTSKLRRVLRDLPVCRRAFQSLRLRHHMDSGFMATFGDI